VGAALKAADQFLKQDITGSTIEARKVDEFEENNSEFEDDESEV